MKMCKLGNKDVAAKDMLTALVRVFLNQEAQLLNNVKYERTEFIEGVGKWVDGWQPLSFLGIQLKTKIVLL